MSAFGGKADIAIDGAMSANDPKRTSARDAKYPAIGSKLTFHPVVRRAPPKYAPCCVAAFIANIPADHKWRQVMEEFGTMVNDISPRGFRWLVIRQSDRKFVKIGTATTKEEAMAAAQTAKRELEAAEKSS